VCNPSYSGGRDQKHHSSKPAQQIVGKTLSGKKDPSQKRAGGVARGVGPEFKTQYRKNQKTKNKEKPITEKRAGRVTQEVK
jgi:hypothetical protein